MANALTYLRYLRTVLWHKTCILTIGCWVNWRLRGTLLRISFARLFFHDWVKFLPVEFIPYARNFAHRRSADSLSTAPPEIIEAFIRAYNHHYRAMDHHWEFHVTGFYRGMPVEQIQANARAMPLGAVIETAIDNLSAQYSYDGSWPPSDWPRLNKLNSSPHFHPASLALLCSIWHTLGFPRPLLSMQSGTQYGWPVAAPIVATHQPYVAAFNSLRLAAQQPSIPLSATVIYLVRFAFDLLVFFGLPVSSLIYFICTRAATHTFAARLSAFVKK